MGAAWRGLMTTLLNSFEAFVFDPIHGWTSGGKRMVPKWATCKSLDQWNLRSNAINGVGFGIFGLHVHIRSAYIFGGQLTHSAPNVNNN